MSRSVYGPVSSRRSALVVFGSALVGLAACAAPPSSAPVAAPPKAAPTAPPPAPTAVKSAQPTAAAKPTAAPKPAAAAPTPLSPVRHARVASTGPQFFNAFFEMAREKKIDREFGVDLEFMIIPSGNATLKSVISGEIDAGSIGPSAMIAAVVEGAELTTIGSNMVKVPHLLWVRGNINSIQDLIGKHWAISAPGDFSHSLGQALLYKYNIDPDKIDWLTLSGGADAARAQALLAGKIDAGALGPEFIPVLKQDPQIKALLEYGKELPQFVRQVVIVNNKSLKEKPEFIQAWVTALIKGSRYGLDHRDETIQLAAKILGVEPNTLGDAFNDHANGIIQPNFDITAEQMNYMQDLNLKLKVQKETVPVEKWLDLRFQKEAVRLLGEYKPARS